MSDFLDGATPVKPSGDFLDGAKPVADPSDGRNAVQRSFDENVRVNPGDSPLKRLIVGAVQGAAQPLVHPLDTASGVVNAVIHPIDTGKAMVQQVKSDPALAAGQVIGGLGLGEAGGAVASAASKVLGPAAGRAALLGKTPEAAYESALKPSTTFTQAEREAVVQTALKNEIPISKGGVAKLHDLIADYNRKIAGEINSDPTRPIDPNAVATRVDAAKTKFANQVNAQGDLNAIEASRQQFLTEQGQTPAVPPKPTGLLDAQGKPIMTQGAPATPAPPMNAADAQAMKQGTYRVLRGKFGEQGSAAVEAQKALARGLKEEIATQFPEISKLNADESQLLDLQPVLERAVARTGNHQAIGIGTPVAAATGAAITGSSGAGAVLGALKGVLDNPMVKSRLAIAVAKGGKIPYAQAMGRVNAYSASLGAASSASSAGSSANPTTQ